jgi:hypothetical protein
MQTILRILERAGGYRPTLYLNLENPPYMALIIEATPEPSPAGIARSVGRALWQAERRRMRDEKVGHTDRMQGLHVLTC